MSTHRFGSCLICKAIFIERPGGRPRKTCGRAKCRAAWKQRQQRAHRAGLAAGALLLILVGCGSPSSTPTLVRPAAGATPTVIASPVFATPDVPADGQPSPGPTCPDGTDQYFGSCTVTQDGTPQP